LHEAKTHESCEPVTVNKGQLRHGYTFRFLRFLG
jgi:hypothetical protein